MVKPWKLIIAFLFLGQCLKGQAIKDTAFLILEEKCNVCHKIEKKETLFSLKNMDMYARKINRQVFIFKVMPKGEEVVLTNREKEVLKAWIRKAKRNK